VPDHQLAFALCFQRGSNRQHPYNVYTAPKFCTSNYFPASDSIDSFSLLSPAIIRFLFQSLTQLLNEKNSLIDLPEPNFLWLSASKVIVDSLFQHALFDSDLSINAIDSEFLCSKQCQAKNQSEKYVILKARCQTDNRSQPCLTTRQTHWDRAPFICMFNSTVQSERQARLRPSYTSEPLLFWLMFSHCSFIEQYSSILFR
jgi:hypothetical protein